MKRLAPALLLAALLAAATAARAAEPPPSEPIVTLDGQPYLEANALARLLGATRFWRPDVRKLVLRSGNHRVVLTADNPFVIVDGRTVRLDRTVRASGDELQVPVALADSLPNDSTLARLVFEPRGRRVVVVPPGGVIGTPRLAATETAVKVTFTCDRPGDARVVGRSRGHFRLHLSGLFAGLLPEPPAGGLVTGLAEIPAAAGSGFELAIAPEAEGWRLTPAGDRVTLEIVRRAGPDYESFAPEGPPGPRSLRVIVLDPGHGGPDSGVTVGPLVESRLALELAGLLKGELEPRLGARVYLTRDHDAAVPADQRAEAANRVRADLVLSLHFDGVPGSRARGATAYCAPATYGARPPAAPPGFATPIEILSWRDVATRHAVRSRDVAETLLGVMELRGQGPARLRERLPAPLLGVNAPGLMLECATLTAAADRARLEMPGGLGELAAAIAEGLAQWEKGE